MLAEASDGLSKNGEAVSCIDVDNFSVHNSVRTINHTWRTSAMECTGHWLTLQI